MKTKNCCECGKEFKPIRSTSKYCSRPCMWKNNGGKNKKKESWWINSRGYVEGRIWVDEQTQIRVKQHRFVMEGILGRSLLDSEDVHHIDGNKTNNDPSNLEIVDHGDHSVLTNASREYKKGYKLKLSDSERIRRSHSAIKMKLHALGSKSIEKATGMKIEEVLK